jgi:hypothetical protein
MVERIIHQLIDDLDGSEIQDGAGESIEFSVRGVEYSIDLSKANAVKFDKALKPYVSAARKRSDTGRRAKTTATRHSNTGTPPRKGPKRSQAAAPEQLDAIREWARQNGYEVSSRGRIRAEVREAFEAAHAT